MIRFWPITARPIKAISAVCSMSLAPSRAGAPPGTSGGPDLLEKRNDSRRHLSYNKFRSPRLLKPRHTIRKTSMREPLDGISGVLAESEYCVVRSPVGPRHRQG